MTDFEDRRYAKYREICEQIEIAMADRACGRNYARQLVLSRLLAEALIRIDDLEASLRAGMLSTIRERKVTPETCSKCGRQFHVMRWYGDGVPPQDCSECAQWPPGVECCEVKT